MCTETAKATKTADTTKTTETTKTADTEPEKVLPSAPPPLHTVALLACLIAFFTRTFPSIETIDKDATIETFTHRVFPDLISLELLGWIRCTCAFFMFGYMVHTTMNAQGWEVPTHYLPNSKLKRGVSIPLDGIRVQMPFTSWSWNLLSLSFGLNGIIALLVSYGKTSWISPWLLRSALLVFETAAPCALLVACVTRYALWPHALKDGGDSSFLKSPQALLWHNANVILALTEVSLLGGLPVQFSHISVAPFFGFAYILFTWYMSSRWKPQDGPHFVYFFLDTTLGTFTSIAILALLGVLVTFFVLFGAMDHALGHLGGGPMLHVLAVTLASSLVCRFRD